jgi:hypothetical protein
MLPPQKDKRPGKIPLLSYVRGTQRATTLYAKARKMFFIFGK